MKLIDLLVKKTVEEGWSWPRGALGAHWIKSIKKVAFIDSEGYIPMHIIMHQFHDIDSDETEPLVTKSQYESALAASEGWIEWGGGECPVGYEVLVECIMSDGTMSDRAEPAHHFRWDFAPSEPYSISKYRLHKPYLNSRANDDRLEQDLNECIGQDVDMPEWNGESLPPVGTKCIFNYDGPDWCWGDKLKNGDEVDIIAHFSARDDSQHCIVAAFTNKNNHHVKVYQAISGCFRPLRTEAEKAREKAIVELASVICGDVPDAGMATAAMYAERVYDAGYRKESK